MSKSTSYIDFLFDSNTYKLKPQYAPVISYIPKSDSFLLKYSVPGYHSPRQYFKFVDIPSQFPNQYVAQIFHFFSITPTLLFRHPKKIVPKPKKSLVERHFGVSRQIHQYDEETRSIAEYNANLALSKARANHSLASFDFYFDAVKILRAPKKVSRSTCFSEFIHLIS